MRTWTMVGKPEVRKHMARFARAARLIPAPLIATRREKHVEIRVHMRAIARRAGCIRRG